MASTKSSSTTTVSKAVFIVVMVMLIACATNPVSASLITVWSGPGCSNRAVTHRSCGCNNIALNGGYQFTYTGQTAALYNQPNCVGVAHTRFNSNARGCSSFGWQSIFFQC